MIPRFWRKIERLVGKRMAKRVVLCAKVMWNAFLTFPLITSLFALETQKSWEIYTMVTPWIICQNLLVITLVVITTVYLHQKVPALRWSWLRWLFNTEGGNIHIMPMFVKYFGLLFGVLLLANLPKWAFFEEVIFRHGTKDWADALIRSLVFGLVHCLVGVPLTAGLAIAISGLWYSYIYLNGGVVLSTVHHTAYNAILISVLLLGLVIKHMLDYSSSQKIRWAKFERNN
jgi:hypothetical protein